MVRSRDGASLAVQAEGGHEVAVARYARCYDAANARLAEGAPLAELRDLVLASGDEAFLAVYLARLAMLCRIGFVEFPLVEEGGERGVIAPLRRAWVPALAPAPPPAALRLDRFACLRRAGDDWLVESPLAGARLALPDLAALDEPLVRRALAGAGLLESAAPDEDPRREILAQWEFHDLLFHTRQRQGWNHDTFGAHFSFIGEIEPLPAVRPSWPGAPIALRDAPAGSEPFAEVLARRRSERRYRRSVSVAELGALLDRAARIRAVRRSEVSAPSGRTTRFEVTRRPFPSAGATHALEIYPVVVRCDGLPTGIYHYDPARHALVRIRASSAGVARYLQDAKRAAGDEVEPQIVLAIAARFARMMWKYRAIAYGNILRDAGALYQTLYLAATELGLSPCGIGAGNSARFAEITGLDPLVEGTVGEFLIGGPPAGPEHPANTA